MLIFALLVLLSGLVGYALLRQQRIQRIQSALQRIPKAQQGEALGITGMTCTELLWHFGQIDPEIVAAADFSSVMSVDSGLDYARFVSRFVEGRSAESLEGFQNRLLGYVGEQRVSDLLIEQGHQVEVAATANQPIWDLIVDGQQVNVKTVMDIASIKQDALAHPNVTYLVPEDAQGGAADNIVRLDGFSHSELKGNVLDSFEQADASAALGDVALHLPVIPLVMSLYRNYHAVQQGRDVTVAAQHVAYDTVIRGGSAAAGAVLGGKIGTIIGGPIGTLVGAAAGGMAGVLWGGQLSEKLKKAPLERALERLQQQLQQLGSQYASRIPRIVAYVQRPLQRQEQHLKQMQQLAAQQQNWRTWLWPSPVAMLWQHTVQIGQQKVAVQQQQTMPVVDLLQRSQATQDYAPVAMMILNVPQLRELLGADYAALQRVLAAQQAVFEQRLQLNPERRSVFEQTRNGLRFVPERVQHPSEHADTDTPNSPTR